MDKRYKPLTLHQQVALRKQAIDDVLANPQWDLLQTIRHIKDTLRLTSQEMAKLAGVSYRTLQDIEQGRSTGTVQTMNKLLGILGLRLGVVAIKTNTHLPALNNSDSDNSAQKEKL